MTHWKLTLAYHGQSFHGWQVQPGLRTVQGTLAESLARLTGEQVLPQGAGRTDTGVHALAQVCSFSLASPVPAANLKRALNRVLPPDVRVLAATVVPLTFHARHAACGKVYEYRIFERRSHTGEGTNEERTCSPFLAPFVWDCRWPLALARMQEAAQHLVGTQDFTAMGASARPQVDRTQNPAGSPGPASVPNPVKTIVSAHWDRGREVLRFRVHGSGFLHHMVRNLVGTLVDIGRGSLKVEDMPRILHSRDRSLAGPTAPPQGLFLVEVLYSQQVGAESTTETNGKALEGSL